MTVPFSRHYYTIIAKICQEAITKNKRADYCPLAVGLDWRLLGLGSVRSFFKNLILVINTVHIRVVCIYCLASGRITTA